MDSVFEVQRQNHEEIERFEQALATVLSKSQTTQQAKLINEHKASQLLDRITSHVTALHNLYRDAGPRGSELENISGTKPDDLSEFYTRLEKVKEFHVKYPDQIVGGFELELATLVDNDENDYDADTYKEEDRA